MYFSFYTMKIHPYVHMYSGRNIHTNIFCFFGNGLKRKGIHEFLNLLIFELSRCRFSKLYAALHFTENVSWYIKITENRITRFFFWNRQLLRKNENMCVWVTPIVHFSLLTNLIARSSVVNAYYYFVKLSFLQSYNESTLQYVYKGCIGRFASLWRIHAEFGQNFSDFGEWMQT